MGGGDGGLRPAHAAALTHTHGQTPSVSMRWVAFEEPSRRVAPCTGGGGGITTSWARRRKAVVGPPNEGTNVVLRAVIKTTSRPRGVPG